jgi:hypothetical protein
LVVVVLIIFNVCTHLQRIKTLNRQSDLNHHKILQFHRALLNDDDAQRRNTNTTTHR